MATISPSATEAALEGQRIGALQLRVAAICMLAQTFDGYDLSSISMAEHWLYYTSPDHPDKCTLWRKLGWDPALVWRRHRGGGSWAYDPGDGTPERPLKLVPSAGSR